MKYNHDIDNKIVDVLQSGPIHFNRLQETIGVNSRTLSSHLKKLCHPNNKIVIKNDKLGKGNEFYYFLTRKTQVLLNYHIFDGIKSRRETREYNGNEYSAATNKKILLLLLLQAGAGSRWLKPISRKPKAGDIEIPDPSKPTGNTTCHLEQKLGVTHQDIMEQKDFGNGGIFRHITFSKHDVIYLFNKLKENELESFRVIDRNDHKNIDEIAIEIKDEKLERLVGYIACLIPAVEENIKYIWMHKTNLPKKYAWDLDWFLSFYGKERTSNVLIDVEQTRTKIKKEMNKEKRQEMIQYVEYRLRLAGRMVVGLYHAEIICDKYEFPLHDNSYLHVYENYRKFVRDLISNDQHKYNTIIQDLIDFVYPKALRRLHNNDPYLIRYVKSISDGPLKQWPSIPVI